MFSSTTIAVAAAIILLAAAAEQSPPKDSGGTTFSSDEQKEMMRIVTAGEACKQKGPSKSACTGDCAINDNGKCDNNYGKMQLDAMGDCAKENPMMKSLLYESACGKLNQTACTADQKCDYKKGVCKIGDAQALLLMLNGNKASVLYKVAQLGQACGVDETTCVADEDCEWKPAAEKCEPNGLKMLKLLGGDGIGQTIATSFKCANATGAPACAALGDDCEFKKHGDNSTKCEANGEKIFADLFKEEQKKNPSGGMLAAVLKCSALKTTDACTADSSCQFKAADQECEMSSQTASDLMYGECGKNNTFIKMMKLGSTCDALKTEQACGGNTDCEFKADEAKCNINDKFYVKAMAAGVKNTYFKVFLDFSQKCDDKLAADECPKDVCTMQANNKCGVSIPTAVDMMSAVGGGSKGDWAVVRKITVGCQASTAAATCTSQTGCRWKDKGADSECDLKWNTPSIIAALKGKGDPDLDSFVGYVVGEEVCQGITGGTAACAADSNCEYKDDEQKCDIKSNAFMAAAGITSGNGAASGDATPVVTASTAAGATTAPVSMVKVATAAKELADKAFKDAGCDADATKAGCAELQKSKDATDLALKKAQAEADDESAAASTVVSVAALVAGAVAAAATF